MRNEKLVFTILMQFLYLDWCIGLRLILLRNVTLQRYYYHLTIKTFRFVNAHLTASKQRWISPSKCSLQNNCIRMKVILLLDLKCSLGSLNILLYMNVLLTTFKIHKMKKKHQVNQIDNIFIKYIYMYTSSFAKGLVMNHTHSLQSFVVLCCKIL